jgi:hypothetical protein
MRFDGNATRQHRGRIVTVVGQPPRSYGERAAIFFFAESIRGIGGVSAGKRGIANRSTPHHEVAAQIVRSGAALIAQSSRCQG